MTDFRLRRAHVKSRSGCARCKQQRKKCDESRPSCSRCAKKEYHCQYQDLRNTSSPYKNQTLAYMPTSELYPDLSNELEIDSEPLALSSDYLSVPGSSPRGSSPASVSSYSPTFYQNETTAPVFPGGPGFLDAKELGLLSHYLSHTSRTIPFDNLDLYALSVGIPNLAFSSKPVMSSLIALAAACKSHQLVRNTHTPLADQTIIEVQRLLKLAEHHHRTSLQYIQEAVSNSDWYDNVLANAALMVLYASASHSIRVHLALIARRSGSELPSDVLPQHSQWITFTRAAHTASTAVLSGSLNTNMERDIINEMAMSSLPELSSTCLAPQSGPSENTKRQFMPLVSSTYERALSTLRRKVEVIAGTFTSQESHGLHHQDLNACLRTLSTLEKCASAALAGTDINGASKAPREHVVLSEKHPRVSSWVGNYMLSVTSMTSPKALRRTIMSFLNEAPSEYLNLVQSVLDSSSVATFTGHWVAHGSPTGGMQPLDTVHLLAIEIFAHWLVLVMLLDGVWWIGGIGRWELGQIVSLMKTQELLHQSPDARESWWPESMYLVNMELIPEI